MTRDTVAAAIDALRPSSVPLAPRASVLKFLFPFPLPSAEVEVRLSVVEACCRCGKPLQMTPFQSQGESSE